MLFWSCLLAFCGRVYAQNLGQAFSTPKQQDNKNALKINALSLIYSTLNLSYQHVVNNTSSVNITASYMDFDSYGSIHNPLDSINGGSSLVESQRTQGFAITPEYRFVTNGKGLSGRYVAPFLKYSYYEYAQVAIMDSTYYNSQVGYHVTTSTFKPDLYVYHTLAFGCVFGKQFLFKNRVAIDIFGGPVLSVLASSNKKNIASTQDVVIGPGIPNAYIKGLGIRAGITVGFIY
jgi:hypothetical protein